MNIALINQKLLSKYDVSAPRYTSYPSALQFSGEFAEKGFVNCAIQSNSQCDKDLSLYFHIPFCAHLCFYCGCSKILTKNKSKGREYLDYLLLEVAMRGSYFSPTREVTQLHLGGGTPTFLTIDQIKELLDTVARNFNVPSKPEKDFSIEIDPRTVTPEYIRKLKNVGFNRISIGVQDFDPAVQRAIHRVQPEGMTTSIIDAAWDAGFDSINLDLIYGLPLQTVSGFLQTIWKVIDVDPDRISLFNYAHMPELFPAQQRIKRQELPQANEKLEMFTLSAQTLLSCGYELIGMDHFAKSSDSLVTALNNGKMQRNFQGYSTHGNCDLVGMGLTSISNVGGCFSQNTKDLKTYYAAVSNNCLPIERGYLLNDDDRLRGDIIDSLMCRGKVIFRDIESTHAIDFTDYFSQEMRSLQPLMEDGLITINREKISITLQGKPLVRYVCTKFDRYFKSSVPTSHSKII